MASGRSRAVPGSDAAPPARGHAQSAGVAAPGLQRSQGAQLIRLQQTIGNRQVARLVQGSQLAHPAGSAQRAGPRMQRMNEAAARALLLGPFGEAIYGNFVAAMQEINPGADDIPDYLIEKLKDLPQHYLPSTKAIWKSFITTLALYKDKPLTEQSIPTRAPAEPATPEAVAQYRKLLMQVMEQKSIKAASRPIPPKYLQLYQNILEGRVTFNFALNTLFKYRQPTILNAFEIEKTLGTTAQNISNDLRSERLNAEYEHFGLPHAAPYAQQTGDHTQWPKPYAAIGLEPPKAPDQEIDPLFRPRYAAINFKNHPFGATPRNDYGMCSMILKNDVKANTTITLGDSFNMEGGPFTATEPGVKALVLAIADSGVTYDAMLAAQLYDPAETYVEAQIHQDIDLRKHVDAIVVSRAEMKLFGIAEDLVHRLIGNLLGGQALIHFQ